MLSPSILIGDSIFIPFFNGYAIPLLIKAAHQVSRDRRRSLRASGLIAFGCSASVNVFLHFMWARDAYTGFIDPTQGALSLGGFCLSG